MHKSTDLAEGRPATALWCHSWAKAHLKLNFLALALRKNVAVMEVWDEFLYIIGWIHQRKRETASSWLTKKKGSTINTWECHVLLTMSKRVRNFFGMFFFLFWEFYFFLVVGTVSSLFPWLFLGFSLVVLHFSSRFPRFPVFFFAFS